MTVGLKKKYIGRKRSIYRRLKAGEEVLRPEYNELARIVRRLTRKGKNNYKLEVANQAKTDHRGI